MIDSSDVETNSPYWLLFIDTYFSRLRQVSANGSSSDIKLSKTQLSKMIKLIRFLPFRFYDPILWSHLIFSIKELIAISLEDSGLLIKDVGKTAENEV